MTFGDEIASRLEVSAEVFKQRSGVYKDNYVVVGRLIDAAFPDGIMLHGAAAFERWHILELMFVKLSRYTNAYEDGGHDDSLTDLAVYATMLAQIDVEQRVAGAPNLDAEAESFKDPNRFLVSNTLIEVGDKVRIKGGNLARVVTALGPTPGRIWVEGMTESIHGALLEKVV